MNIFYSLIAQNAAPQGGLFGGPWGMTLMMVGFIAIFYFLVVMPQNKKKKETQKMFDAMKKGDKVVTIGGLHGKISSIKDNEVVIKIDANAELTVEKNAIARIVNQGADAVSANK